MKHALLAIVALAVIGCTPAEPPPPEGDAQEEVALLWNADTRTVLSGDAARALANQCSRVSPGPVQDVWTPDDTQIGEMEDELILLVSRELEAIGESPSPGDYYRQIAGFVIGGRRVIYVNGVRESAVQREPDPQHPFDWRTQAITICDGGAITFGVEYDPATRQFQQFEFNGSIGGPLGQN